MSKLQSLQPVRSASSTGIVGVRVLAGALVAFVVALPGLADAAPYGGPLVGFGNAIFAYLTVTIAPIVAGIGIAVALICWALGSRDGLMRAVQAAVAAAALFALGSIINFIQQIAQ